MKAQVYVMRGPDALKIGFSKDPETRLAALRPDGAIEVLSAVEVLDARAVEAAAHSLLVEKRKSGEWFFVTLEEATEAITAAIQLVETGEWQARRKAQEQGRHRLSAMLSAEGSAVYAELRDRYASERELVEVALASLARRNELSREELLAEIARRLR